MAAERPYEERSRPGDGLSREVGDTRERYAESDQEKPEDGRRCPNCGFHCVATADLCEACGHWLLDGQCRYCYQPFKPGQRFCTHCGNPPEGIVCKQCNTKTHFDVCPTCHIPLSRRAGPAQEAMREQQRLILSAVQEMMSVVSEEEAVLEREVEALKKSGGEAAPVRRAELDQRKEEANRLRKALGQLEDYYGQDPPAGGGGSVATPAFGFSAAQRDFSAELHKGKEAEQARADKARAEARRVADDQARIEGVLRQIEEVKKRKENALLADKIRQLQGRTFPDAQSARMYSMQLQEVLTNLGACEVWIGWKCNRYSAVHLNGPGGCSAPELGGRWVCESEVVYSGAPGEFILEGVQYCHAVENPQARMPVKPE